MTENSGLIYITYLKGCSTINQAIQGDVNPVTFFRLDPMGRFITATRLFNTQISVYSLKGYVRSKAVAFVMVDVNHKRKFFLDNSRRSVKRG